MWLFRKETADHCLLFRVRDYLLCILIPDYRNDLRAQGSKLVNFDSFKIFCKQTRSPAFLHPTSTFRTTPDTHRERYQVVSRSHHVFLKRLFLWTSSDWAYQPVTMDKFQQGLDFSYGLPS